MSGMIKHVLAGGCSFTANGQGGLPPSTKHPEGGNSYTYNLDTPIASWASYVAKKLNSSSFFNVAVESHGNYLTAISIVQALLTFNYSPNDTLVLFNITDLERFDLLTTDNESKSKYQSWGIDLLGYNIVDRKLSDPIRKIKGDSQIIESNLMIIMLINFLESYNIKYRFLMMADYSSVIDKTLLDNKNLIKLPDGIGMIEYCKANNLTISKTDNHPSIAGHAQIGKLVLDSL